MSELRARGRTHRGRETAGATGVEAICPTPVGGLGVGLSFTCISGCHAGEAQCTRRRPPPTRTIEVPHCATPPYFVPVSFRVLAQHPEQAGAVRHIDTDGPPIDLEVDRSGVLLTRVLGMPSNA